MAVGYRNNAVKVEFKTALSSNRIFCYSCEAVSASDYVEFSNYMSPDRKHSRHCGQLKEFDIKSDRKFFRVTFKSNDRLDGTGFNASYVFFDEEDNYTMKTPLNGSTSTGKITLSIILHLTSLALHNRYLSHPH